MSWAPPGKYLWDCWFANDKIGQLHAFYLQADKETCNFDPERRHNQASVGHAIRHDSTWIEVTDVKPALAAAVDGWDNISIWTGSIIFDPRSDHFYMFYTSRNCHEKLLFTPRGEFHPQQIGIAVSGDLTTWAREEKTKLGPVIKNPAPMLNLDGVNWRDPFVFKVNETYHCLLSARCSDADDSQAEAGGVVVILSSNNLLEWNSSNARLLTESADFYQMEVPQLFCETSQEKKRYYLIFCAQAADCSRKRREEMPDSECQTGTYYICSDEFAADSEEIPFFNSPARLLARDIYAGKIIEHEGKTLLSGFDYRGGETSFIGGIIEPVNVLFSEDGTLALG